MKVECINNDKAMSCLTEGKQYDVIKHEVGMYLLKSDNGETLLWNCNRFLPVPEVEVNGWETM